MSTIVNGGLDQYGAEPFKQQQQYGTAGVEGVKKDSAEAEYTRPFYYNWRPLIN